MVSGPRRRAAVGASVVALVAGLLLGPGYYVYVAFFSGATLAEQRVFERPDGGAAVWRQPFEIELTPEMNPLSVVAPVELSPEKAPHRRRSRIEMALRRDGEAVWQEAVEVLRPESDSRGERDAAGAASAVEHLAIRRFEVSEAGRSALSAALAEPQEVPIAEIALQVRRNAIEPSTRLLLGAGPVC